MSNVVVQPTIHNVIVDGEMRSVIIATPGPQGPSGALTDEQIEEIFNTYLADNPLQASTYTHTQGVPSNTWVVTHNLNRHPSITVVDSAGTVVVGDHHYDSANQLTITFSAAFAGVAYLN